MTKMMTTMMVTIAKHPLRASARLRTHARARADFARARVSISAHGACARAVARAAGTHAGTLAATAARAKHLNGLYSAQGSTHANVAHRRADGTTADGERVEGSTHCQHTCADRQTL